jgi:hypothetical protein
MSAISKTILPSECIPGRFYVSSKWGKVLCCGTHNIDEYFPAFAYRTPQDRVELKFLSDDGNILLECIDASEQTVTIPTSMAIELINRIETLEKKILNLGDKMFSSSMP